MTCLQGKALYVCLLSNLPMLTQSMMVSLGTLPEMALSLLKFTCDSDRTYQVKIDVRAIFPLFLRF